MAVMPGTAERIERAERLLSAAREAGVPVVFFQEVHRRSGIDFGRELDGAEGEHCLDGDVGDRTRRLMGEPAAPARQVSSTSSSVATRGSSAPSSTFCSGRSTRPPSCSSAGSPTSACSTRSPTPTSATSTSGSSATASAVRVWPGTPLRWTRWSTCKQEQYAPLTRSSAPSAELARLPKLLALSPIYELWWRYDDATLFRSGASASSVFLEWWLPASLDWPPAGSSRFNCPSAEAHDEDRCPGDERDQHRLQPEWPSGSSPTGHTLNLSFFMDPGQPGQLTPTSSTRARD